MKNHKGLLIVLSGPSGCGKGTLVAEMLKRGDCAVSVSATTREPRVGEVDGEHYHFLSEEQFTKCIEDGKFLEHAGYVGHRYGTLREEVEALRESGKHVILEIEVQGAMQVREECPEAILIFTIPPSIAEQRRRLHKRGTETDGVIEERIDRAKAELPYAKQYDYIILNDGIEDAVADFAAIIRTETLHPDYFEEQIGEMEKC